MRLTLLRSECPDTESCPTLYWTDHGTVVVRGTSVTDPEALDTLHLPIGEAAVEIDLVLPTNLTKQEVPA